MLLGREPERQRLAALIASARSGRGGTLVLRGDPGIGKTALVGWARESAEGFGILSATGVQSEAELPYVALGDALRPALARRANLAEPQRAALEAALALGPPAISDRFAAYAGAFALLEEAALERPLLLTVDDVHWLDAASAEAIAFAARRLEDLPAAVIVTQRPNEGREFTLPGADVLPLARLSEDAAQALLVACAEGPVDGGVARRLLDVAEGNPLALIELPRALTAAERDGRAPLPEPLRVGEALARAFRLRLENMDTEAQRGVVVAAAGAEDHLGTLLAACARLDCSPAALERAEAAGVLTINPGRIAFAHPLLRAVAVELARPRELREAHRALADAIAAERGPERRAWHLARAAIGADEEAASALEAAASAAAARTAYATGTDALVRAAGLTMEENERARRLMKAAGLAQMGGQLPLAAGLLEQAAPLAAAPALAAELDHLRGLLRIYTGPYDEAVRLLFDSAERVAEHDAARAALMLADASLAWGIAGHPAMCIVACRRALSLEPLPEAVRRHVELGMLTSMFYVGQGRRVRESAVLLQDTVARLDPLTPEANSLLFAIAGQMYVGELDFAQREIDRAIASLRAAGALGPLAFYLALNAELAFRRAGWPDGLAAAEEAAGIAEETGQTPIAGYALALLARLEGASGRDAECRAHLDATERIAAASGSGALLAWGGHALGLLELGLGHHEEAIAALEPVAAVWETESMRCAEVLSWRHDLIEAYVRVGRAADARRQLRSLAEEAHASGGAGVLALTARCRGLIDPDNDRHFEEALALHERLPIPFDVARTRLCYGERLRRDRRRARAREQLEAALAIFDALGARPWAERTRAELAAAGAPAPKGLASAIGSLTPRELQVALAVSRGATNREAAAALFLSAKTIERHLSAVYAKLGLRSRSELARRLAGDGSRPT